MPAAGPQSTRKAQRKARKPKLKVKAPAPSKATNNAQSYVSQGRAVEKAANQQKARVRNVRDTKSNADLGKAKAYKKTDTYDRNKRYAQYQAYRYAKKRGRGSEQIKKAAARGDEQSAAIAAPVLRVLDQTTRVNHAIMGAARHDVQEFKKHGPIGLVGHGSLKEAKKGLENKTKYTGSDVLKEAGVKNKTVRAVGGFIADVGLDPVTYATGGTATVAKHAGEKAALSAEKKAAKAGLSEAQVKRFGERARKQAEKQAPEGKRVTVKAGSLKASVKAPKVKAPKGVKSVVADVNPNAAPAGVAKETSDAAVRATRAARAKTGQGERDAARTAHGIRKRIGEDNYSRVIDALEAGKIGSLPEELRGHAVTLRSTFRHLNRTRKRAGIKGGEIKRRPRVKVPGVTADVEGAQKGLRAAQAERSRVERAHRSQVHRAGVAEGRARVLVGQADRRAGSKATGKRPVRTLSKLERERGKLYAMDQGDVVTKVRKAVRDAEQHLEDTKALARTQRSARLKAQKAADSQVTEAKEYVPHILSEEAKAAAEAKAGGVGKRVVKPGSSKRRAERRPLAVLRDEKPGKYREDLDAITGMRAAEGTRAAAQADLNRGLAGLGRDVKRGKPLTLGDGEAVFHIKGSDIRKVTDDEAARAAKPLKLNKAGTKLKGANKQGGRYVILNEDLVKRSLEGASAQLQGPGIVHAFDKTTGAFKRVALATPGFHLRNLVGDTFQAYVKQPAHKLPGNLNKSRKVLKHLDNEQIAREQLARPKPSGETLKTGKYGHVSLEDIAHNLVKAGAARSGYTARELRELSESGGVKKGGRVRQSMRKGRKAVGESRPGAFSKRLLLNREDLPRLATAIHALEKGASWEEAAAHVAETHFDYGHLTSFERNVARRVLPFYTWSARNIPFTAKNVVARPGKYANFQKVREEAAKATGADQQDPRTRQMYDDLRRAGVKLPKGWEQNLSEWEQRNAGVPIKWKGHAFTVSMGLPLQDLNEFPGAAGKSQGSEWTQKFASLVNPIPKDITEYTFNYSFFFRDQIERDNSPNVAAPAYVAGLPDSVKKNLKVVKIVDKKTGKMVWSWPAKMDYLAKAIPGTPNYLQQLATSGTDRRGKGTTGKALAFAGVKSVPVDPNTNAVNLAYGRMAEIQKEQARWRQRGVNADHPNAAYRKLTEQLHIVTRIAYQGKAARGDKVLPTQGGPRKPRVRKPSTSQPQTGRFSFGSSSSGSSSSSSSGSSGGRFVFH